jgi:RNA polymerase sigma factor (sigma-70 family)
MKPNYELSNIGHDPEAFEVFYRENVEAVQRFIARRVSDPYLAADLTTEVFLAAIESSGSYRSHRGTPIAWLYGVARIVVASERRRAGRELGAQARLAGRRLLSDDDIARMDERIDAAATKRELFSAVERLPDGEREVLELTALDDLSVADAAAALNLRPVTARVRLHRAKRTLREQLNADESRIQPTPLEAKAP